MGEVVAISLGAIFTLLSLLHIAWALGLKWGFQASLPTDEKNQKVLNPKPRDSFLVGAGLGFFAAFYLSAYAGVQMTASEVINQIFAWAIPLIFLLRSVGDFKYFGFFKKVTTTSFSRLDTNVIIPLCLLISLLGFLLVGLS